LLATSRALAACLSVLSLLSPPIRSQTPMQPSAPTDAQTHSQSTAITTSTFSPSVLTIRMLNGKSGKPLGNRFIAIEFQNSPHKPLLYINKQGMGHLPIPPGATAFSLIAPARKRGANQAAYIVCGPFGQWIPIQNVLQHGYVPQNECNANLPLTAAPGELLYLITPLPWYTPALE
jgi:hypothetical protein